MRVIVPEFINSEIAGWRPFDRGRVGVVLAQLEDDYWRLERQVDWELGPSDKAALGLSESDIVWAVSAAGVTVAFLETISEVRVVYINRLSAMSPGW